MQTCKPRSNHPPFPGLGLTWQPEASHRIVDPPSHLYLRSAYNAFMTNCQQMKPNQHGEAVFAVCGSKMGEVAAWYVANGHGKIPTAIGLWGLLTMGVHD